MRRFGPVLALAFALALPGNAAADVAPLGHACSKDNGVRFCPTSDLSQRVKTFDGVPLDVDVTLPSTGAGPFPTIVMLHGWGGSKTDFEASKVSSTLNDYTNLDLAHRGYAVVTYSARGFGQSCGAPASRTPDCLKGWIHLADQRYEARDTQTLLGMLVDEGIAKPDALGVTGVSYGGGQSVMLAFLKDRVRNADGSFSRWKSPKGTPLHIAAAYPRWPWSDLVYSLQPNGRFLDFRSPAPLDSQRPIGVTKQSYVEGLYALGLTTGFYAPPGADSQADLTSWHVRVMQGEPEDDSARAIAKQIATYHQGFGLSGIPAPLLIENGWTDGLFPAIEALRVYNHVRELDPRARVALQLGDLGHQRGSNKDNVDKYFFREAGRFFDAYLKRSGSAPAAGSVTAFTQTCPRAAPGGGPYKAASWRAIHPGAVRFGTAAAQTVSSSGGNPSTAAAMDPIAGGGDACASVDAEHAAGTAVYLAPKSRGSPLLGLPTVSAQIKTSGAGGQLDARLWDVAPDGTQTLVSRGPYRLSDNQSGALTFQLYGNAWRFESGHTPKLELLGRDAPFMRASNDPFSVEVKNVKVELPTLEAPNGAQIVRPLLGRPVLSRLRVSVRPRRAKVGRRTRFRFKVTGLVAGRRVPIAGARVAFAHKRARTNSRGRAKIVARLRSKRLYRARASRSGFLSGKTRVRARRVR